MSTSSAGTHINFGSQAFPEPEEGEAEAPAANGREPRATKKQVDAPEAEVEAARVLGAAPLGDPPGSPQLAATSSVAAEAQQGDGPAAASASGSAVGTTSVASRAVSVVIGPHGAAAACELGVAVVGPQGAAAASSIGVASAGPSGAAAAGNGANSSTVAIDAAANGHQPALPDMNEALEQRLTRLERENRELRDLVSGNGARNRR